MIYKCLCLHTMEYLDTDTVYIHATYNYNRIVWIEHRVRIYTHGKSEDIDM